jgi:choline dehydrogenase-like flavoprotein
MTKQVFDAIVVGSGVTGGWAAKELTERGLNVLVLERGREIRHKLDYAGENMEPWEVPFAGLGRRELYASDYFIQSHSQFFDESTRHLYNNDRENPYVYDPKQPFLWIRANGVGGRSLIWGRQCYRFSPQDFEANRIDGHGVDWPIRYPDLEPWYSHVERFIGVSGQREGLTQLPDGEFLPPMKMFGLEKLIQARLAEKLPQLTMTIGRTAILTQDHGGRGACTYCGPCPRGCSTGSYFSSQSSTLPAAQATGRLTIHPDSVVERLVYDPRTRRITEVQVLDANTLERRSFGARLIFLCASTAATTQLLLHSRSEHCPDGVANSSGVVGRYLMDHVLQEPGVTGVFVDQLDRDYYAHRPNCMYIPRFRNLSPGGDGDTSFLRGYALQAYTFRADWRFGFNRPGFGRELKDALRKPSFWAWTVGGFGECLPRADNRIVLEDTQRDRYGMPQVRFDFRWSDNELRMHEDMVAHGVKIMQAAGAVYIVEPDRLPVPGLGVHEMGTARMGNDPRDSVLNGFNQAHDVPNLFITDGSCMTSSATANPSLTYMALTARAAAHAVSQLHAGL